MKTVLVVLLSFVTSVYAGYDDYSVQEKEAFYDAGMCLAHQHKITDWKSLKKVSAILYDDIEEVQQIVDLFLMMNGSKTSDKILASDQLFDMIDDEVTQNSKYVLLQKDFVLLVAAYQHIFYVFIDICPCQPTLTMFLNCLVNQCDVVDSIDQEMFVKVVDDFLDQFEQFQLELQDAF